MLPGDVDRTGQVGPSSSNLRSIIRALDVAAEGNNHVNQLIMTQFDWSDTDCRLWGSGWGVRHPKGRDYYETIVKAGELDIAILMV